MSRGGIKRENWEARIFSKIKKTRGCWLWQGLQNQGYGFARWQGRFILIHRFVFQKLVGKIPRGLELDHLCRVRNCVNPAHLEPVTTRENVLRGYNRAAVNARRSHCVYGHPLSGENLYRDPGSNHRRCRKCIARRTAEWRSRQ